MASEANELHFWGKHAAAFQDVTTRELDIEGAVRAGKTTVCLCRELQSALRHPGIHILLARWTDSGVYGLLLPLSRHICGRAGVPSRGTRMRSTTSCRTDLGCSSAG